MTRPASGIELARRYHEQVVGPLLARHRPSLRHAAAWVGSGSDVLGFDDDRSRDHDWGLRLSLFVDGEAEADDVRDVLEAHLPPSFEGWPTRFPTTWDPAPSHEVGVGPSPASPPAGSASRRTRSPTTPSPGSSSPGSRCSR